MHLTDMKVASMKLDFDNDKDEMKVSLYFNVNRKLDTSLFKVVEDLNAFNSFNWVASCCIDR